MGQWGQGAVYRIFETRKVKVRAEGKEEKERYTGEREAAELETGEEKEEKPSGVKKNLWGTPITKHGKRLRGAETTGVVVVGKIIYPVEPSRVLRLCWGGGCLSEWGG